MPKHGGRSIHGPALSLRLVIPFVFLSFASVSYSVAESPTTEYKVKAAMIYKILKFVRWPDETMKASSGERELNICILGEDPFGDAIDAVEGRSVSDYKISITRLERVEEIDDQCHALFVSPSMERWATAIHEATMGWPVLTIGDSEEFAESGGHIELVKARQRIGFEINKTQADNSGLHISSQLLAIAKGVF